MRVKGRGHQAALIIASMMALTACQRVGGLAPFSLGGDDKALSAGGAVIAQPGDTLFALSRRYEVPLRDLIEINHLSAPYTIEVGQRLTLPAARQYIVRSGDTLYGVSRMFGVDVSELTRLNNLRPPYDIKSGQPLRLPSPSGGYGGDTGVVAGGAPRPVIERSEIASTSAPTSPQRSDFNPNAPSVMFEPGREPRTLQAPGSAGVARGAPLGVSIVPAPVLTPPGGASATPTTTGVRTVTVKPPPQTENTSESATDTEFREVTGRTTVESPSAEAPAPTAKPSAKPAPPPKAEEPKPVETASREPPPAREPIGEPSARGGANFLMPVQGRIISGFGPKPGGQHNDGLNIQAARGTSVIAADNGVVVYAGNELRGYGNLLLIRHADGWITAYAHLDRMDVERGAQVKRGQAIGTVGQTGGVASPQLHFELRKGNEAVDPKGKVG